MGHSEEERVSIADIYREHYATYRQLNGVLYQLPVLFSTILGGLYYFGFSYVDENRNISIFVFLFSSLVSFLFLVIVMRFGLAFSEYINKINEFDGEHKITLRGQKGMSTLGALRLILRLMIFSGCLLAFGTYNSFFDKVTSEKSLSFICNNCTLEKLTPGDVEVD